MVKRFVLSLMLGLACAFSALAQDKLVTGTVVGDDGHPVVGAVVVVDGSAENTVTDSDGEFAISASGDAVLSVSSLGYETAKVSLNGRSSVKITLRTDSYMLEDVVVTGYGTQRKAAFTGSATVVGDEALSRISDSNFAKALEGAVPGLQMFNTTGMPGTSGTVYVRGRGSFNSGTQPLYVIDGMPINADADEMSSDSNSSFDPLAAINPADIESITVLKDASATAIYGSRASNGVIVITTKKGADGKFNLNVDIKQGFVTMANNNMKFANAEQTMDLFANGYANYTGASYDDAYAFMKDQYFGWDGKTSTDWMDEITRNGHYQDYNMSFSGSTGATNYYASLGYLNTKGLVIASDLQRFSGRFNIDSKFKVFTFGVNSSYSYSIKNGFSQSMGGSFSTPTVAAIAQMSPFDAPYLPDGSYNMPLNYNPLALWDEELGDIQRSNIQTININPYLRVDFGKGIYAKTSLGVNIMDYREYNYWSAVYNNQGADYNGLGQQYNTKNSVITWTNILGWDYTFKGKHNVGIMLGQEIQMKDRFMEYLSGYDFPLASSGYRDLSTAGTWNDSQYTQEQARLASFFVDAHYSYADKYYVSASFRRDGSSVFGAKHKWGNFWSVGAKWRLSEENFLKGNSILTNAALRASYGTVGNQDIAWYAARGVYTAGYNYNGAPGLIPTRFENADLTWETSNKFDVGFDLSFINRIGMTFDFYNEVTSDALYEVPLSMTTGLSSIYQNVASIRNRGIEFAVNAAIIQSGDFVWNVNANITWNENEVIKLATDEPIESSTTIIEEGRPFRQFYMREYAGVDRETGAPLWYKNETGTETTSNYGEAVKRYVGAAEPKVFGGFGTSLNWKGLDFNINFAYRLGGKVYDMSAPFIGQGMSFMTPLEDIALNSWTPENKDAKYPQYIYGDPYYSTQDSSRFLYDGNYLKISNITLGYSFPKTWMNRILLENLRIYVSVDNPYIFTAKNFIGYTPETFQSGLIAFQHPASTTFIGGIQFTF